MACSLHRLLTACFKSTKLSAFFTVSFGVGDDLHLPLINVAEHDVRVRQAATFVIHLAEPRAWRCTPG
jgi:hypothetical protein